MMKKQPTQVPQVRERLHPPQGTPANVEKRNFKLLVDPQLKKGQEKLTRFNGDAYSCTNHGQRPVVVRDPRPRVSRLWARRERVDLPVPRYKVDDWYVGAVPPREVTFSKLNDNITKQFMEQLCGKYGKLERVRVYHHPKTDKHMGLAKVVFASIKSASICIERLHQTSIMGNIINAEMDCKGELLKKLFNKIIKGEMMADTMPDVIKHTQEKPQPRPIRKQRRKSSQEDPRRKSSDSIDRRYSIERSSSLQGPKTPPPGETVAAMDHTEQTHTDDDHMTDTFDSNDQEFVTSGRLHFQQHQHNSINSDEHVMQNPPPVSTDEHHSRGFSAQLHRVPPIPDLSNSQSLESGYESRPTSAAIIPDQGSPFGSTTSQDHDEEALVKLPVDDKFDKKKHKSRRMKRNSSEENTESEHKPQPALWSKDLENRIETLLTEQNKKYNLENSSSKMVKQNSLERRHSEISQADRMDSRKPSDYDDDLDVVQTKQEQTPEDLEDGECSGDDPNEEEEGPQISEVKKQVKSERTPVTIDANIGSESQSERGMVSPSRKDFIENSRQRFSRSPSPTYNFHQSRSPPRGLEVQNDRPEFEGRPDGRGRFSPGPGEYFHGHPFPHDRFRHPSPGRPVPEFADGRFPHDRFEPRPRSPSFEHRRRLSPPFDGRHHHVRSPVYDHHRHRHSPGRGRPPSPGFMRPDIPPGHPDFGRRRSPSPGFVHRRRSISPPRRFDASMLRREFDGSPRRERYYSPHEMDRHRREMSPRFEHERHRRRSPTLRHDHRPPNIPRSPDSRRQRDHRELPPEFRERWARQRSISPPHHSHPRLPAEHMPHSEGHMGKRSRSSSPDALHKTPPRIRSPAHMHPDHKPYSPGDLPLEESTQSEGPHPSQSSVPTDNTESDSGANLSIAARRKQRESSDHDAPQISLDERLREITGEPPPEPDSPPPSVHPEEDNEGEVKGGSPAVSEDMEISSGGGGSEQGDHNSPHVKQGTPGDMCFRNEPFHPMYPGPPGQPWRFNGPGPQDMWNGYNPRFHMNQRPMWCPPGGEPSRFPTNMHNGFPPRFMPDQRPFDNNMLPPPPPGWDRPWVQGQQPPHMMGAPFGSNMNVINPGDKNQNRNPNGVLGDCVLNRISKELKEIVKRDLNRKVIESMAFKVYESWWDEQWAIKNPKPLTITSKPPNNVVVKTEPGIETPKPEAKPSETESKPTTKTPGLLNTFDPLNWAKGSLEMDGFRIGLGFRSAISKMPSFRVKKRTPSPTPLHDKKANLSEAYRKSKDKDKRKDIAPTRKRIWLDSEGEEEEESDQESSDYDDEAKDAKSRVLDVDDVFSSSESSSEEEEETSDEEDESEEESEEEELEDDKYAVKKEFITKRHSVEDNDEEQPPKKKHKIEDGQDKKVDVNERFDSELQIKVERLDDAVTQAALSLSELQSRKLSTTSSLLSPSAPAGADLTQKHLRHVHPKKRYRLLSKDETRNLDLIAEVSDRLRSDDEVSSMSDKEKAALEILTDMKTTPERRLSSTNRFSESSDSSEQPMHPPTPGRQLSESVFSPPATPIMPRRASHGVDSFLPVDSHIPTTPGGTISPLPPPPIFNDMKKSGDEELEAVEALLSIKQSQPPIPPLSPPTLTKVKQKSKKQQRKAEPPKPKYFLTQEDRDRMVALAEEHNYFSLSPRREHKVEDMSIDPAVLRIKEEHSYSYPPSLSPTQFQHDGSTTESLFESDFLPSVAEDLSAISAAERVKRRRETPKSSKKKSKSSFMRDHKAYAEQRRKSFHEFMPRSQMDEMSLLSLMWTTGLDLEDMKLLRYEYEQMLTQTNIPQWTNDTHWVAHPITNIPDSDASPSCFYSPMKRTRKRRSKKNDMSDLKPHKTGCARTEGYYKVAAKTKLIQRRLMYRQADNTEQPGGKYAVATSSNNAAVATEKSREARHMMRRIASEFGSDVSDLIKYNQLMYRKKSVKFKRSQIHGWGLFAEETIGADEMVIEYVGQLVRSLVADRREVDYTKRGIGSSYLFRIDSDHIIDATKCGNYARFMNHSCNPSCYAKVITVDGAKKIVIYSKDTIKPSDEITYDYKFPIEDVKIPCFCGAINCRGTLN